MRPTRLPTAQERRRWLELARLLSPDISPTALQLMEEMRLVAHALKQLGERSLSDSGLSYAQYRVLMNLLLAEKLGDKDELNPSEISEQQGTSRNTISALIRSLESEGLIERHLDEGDRRRFNISLTDRGRELVLEHARHHLGTIGGCFAALTPNEQQTLSRLLRKLGQASQNVDDEASERVGKADPA